MSRRLHPPLNFGGIASLVQDDEGNCGWMARIISDLAPPAGISQGLGVAIKLNAPPHTESTPFVPFDMRLRVHGMQQGARTRATPIPLRRRVRWMPRNGVRFLGIFGNISCNIILKFCNFTIWVGRDSLGTSIWKYNKNPLDYLVGRGLHRVWTKFDSRRFVTLVRIVGKLDFLIRFRFLANRVSRLLLKCRRRLWSNREKWNFLIWYSSKWKTYLKMFNEWIFRQSSLPRLFRKVYNRTHIYPFSFTFSIFSKTILH